MSSSKSWLMTGTVTSADLTLIIIPSESHQETLCALNEG